MTTEELRSDRGPARRRWKPIRLGTLLIVVLIVGLASFWYTDRCRLALPTFRQGERLAIRQNASRPNAPASPPRTEWKLPSGLALMLTSIDVSSDRRNAVVWGGRAVGEEAGKSCWVIDLQTAEIDDLLTRPDGKVAAIVRDPASATFSPDGRHLLLSARAKFQ